MDTLTVSNIIFTAVPLILGIILSVVIIPKMMLISIKDGWATHPSKIDESGFKALQIAGLSIFPVLLLTLCISGMAPMCMPDTEYAIRAYHMVPRVLQIITGSTLLFIAGLKYDMHGSSSFVRASSVLLASCLFPIAGLCITDLHGLFGIHEIPFWMGCILTVSVSMYIIEMVKLLDGMNGLASGTVTIALLLFLPICACSDGITPAVVAGGTLGVVLPFWTIKRFSNTWSKALMGNSGCYVLGYILAFVFISLLARTEVLYFPGADLVAVSILLMPGLDTIRVIGSRARDGRSLITPDRNQIDSIILRTGLPEYSVFPLLLLFSVIYSGITYGLVTVGLPSTLILLINIILWGITELSLIFFIHRREVRTHQTAWNKEYGEDAWNASIPYEQIEIKQRVYGTMGLPSHIIEGTGTEFIPDGMNAFERNTKRLFDFLIAACCLVVFSPLFLLSYILIKLDDGGPAIYKQERLGRFGRPFNIYKYRSMRLDAEKMGPQLSHAGGDDDPRLTKIGKFLRRHHLDELPQLWNVFKGDMAFIGYRPERKFFIDQIMEEDPRYAFLYQIRPGVTSYATLYNGYTDTMEKMLRRLELDLYYLGHRSFWLDCKILFLTFTSIVFGKKF